MGRDRAAYMREYRAERKVKSEASDFRDALIKELGAEVVRLRRELAARPKMGVVRPRPIVTVDDEPRGFNTRPFTPVPKKGK